FRNIVRDGSRCGNGCRVDRAETCVGQHAGTPGRGISCGAAQERACVEREQMVEELRIRRRRHDSITRARSMTVVAQRVAIAAFAVAVGADILSAQQPRARNTADVNAQAAAIAADMCATLAPSGPKVVVAGPQLQVADATAVNGASTVAAQYVRRLRPGILIAVNANWVAVYDSADRSTTRLACDAGGAITRRGTVAATRLSISNAGDVSLLTESGAVVLEAEPLWTSPQAVAASIVPPDDHGPGRALIWLNRTLWILRDTAVSLIDPRPESYAASFVGVRSHDGRFVEAFAYNGLIYAVNDDGCIDLLSSQLTSPRLRRVSCMPQSLASQVYFALEPDTFSLVSREGDTVWRGPRLTMVVARLTG